MTDRFQTSLAFVLEREGGYSNHAADRGGATNKGVTQAVYDGYRTTNGLPVRSVQEISDTEIQALYRAGYWDAVHGDSLLAPIDLVMFDSAVNHGAGQAIRFLQRASNNPSVDGHWGQVTAATLQHAIDAEGPMAVADNVIAQREIFYHNLVAKDASQGQFLNGWLSRLQHLHKAIA